MTDNTRGRGNNRNTISNPEMAARIAEMDEKALEGANIVRPLATQIAEGIEQRNMDMLAKAVTVTYQTVCARLKEVKHMGIMFPRQKFLPEIGKNPLSSALLSFLKTKYIFETSTKSNGVTSSEVAWTTIFDSTKGIATGIANGSYSTPLPSSLLWDLMTETLFVFTLMNDGRNNATPSDPNTLLRFQPSELLAELKSIADKSGFAQAIAAGTSFETATANRELLILGLFAQITLVIVHVLIADFRGALREAAPLMIFGNGRRIIAELSGSAYINLYYHVGVAFVLLRRYTDAAQMLSSATAAPPVGNYDERVRNSSKSMLAMISVLAGLSLHEESADGEDDGVTDLRRGHLGRFRGTFFANCPRFVTFGIAAEGQVNIGKEQVAETFMRQVQQQIPNLTMRGHFNVYTTMNLEKVALLRQNSKHVSTSVAAESSPFQVVLASQMAAIEQVHKADDANPLSATVVYAPAGKLRIEADFIASVPSENLITDVLVKRIAEIHGQ